MNKKSQGAAAAAALVAVILGLMIFYILSVPPSERAKLLGEEKIIPSTKEKVPNLLLKASPGRIDYPIGETIEHPPRPSSVIIYTKEEAVVLQERPFLKLKRTSFSSEDKEISFAIADLENTKDLLLSFYVEKGEGNLIIKLNNEEIFNNELTPGAVSPIKLPGHLLKEENKLFFGVSSPGAAFWKTYLYEIKNIKIVAQVTDTKAQKAKVSFLVSETEKNNLESTSLKLFVSCQQKEVGKLTIYFNEEEIYSGLPECENYLVLEIPPEKTKKGQNELEFWIKKGTFYLSPITFTSRLRAIEFPTYYFEISEEQFNDVKEGKKKVNLYLYFTDLVDRKIIDLVVNGRYYSFDGKEAEAKIDLSKSIVKGRNSLMLKLKPGKTIEIRELKAILE